MPSAKRSRKGEAATNGKLQLACHMTTYGFAIVHNVPTVKGAVAQFGNAVGHVRTTNYGDIFDVIDLGSQGNNLARTNVAIPAHTDNPYRDPFPTVQLLHPKPRHRQQKISWCWRAVLGPMPAWLVPTRSGQPPPAPSTRRTPCSAGVVLRVLRERHHQVDVTPCW